MSAMQADEQRNASGQTLLKQEETFSQEIAELRHQLDAANTKTEQQREELGQHQILVDQQGSQVTPAWLLTGNFAVI